MVVFQPKNTAQRLCKCPARCHFPTPHDWHTGTSLPGSVSILPQEKKCVRKVIITSSKFPLVIHRAAQGGIGYYTHVIGLLFNDCLVSPESELYGITQLSQGPVSWLHSDIAIFVSWDFFPSMYPPYRIFSLPSLSLIHPQEPHLSEVHYK